jgi:hypothetical protein
MENAKLMECY